MIDFQLEGLAAEPEAAYTAQTVNRELNRAWEIVEETGANLFLTGRAGTGKTTFLRKLQKSSAKRIVVLAPTGVAAINAQGSTIHSFFQFPFSPYIPGRGFASGNRRYSAFSKQKKRILASMSLLVIDEVSMVRPDILDAIDNLLRRFRNRSLPFGGVQLLLIGDLRQLPPVVSGEEWQFLSEYYRTPYFFESIALRQAGFQTVELTTIYRQRDAEFISLLNRVRDGNADFSTLEALNSRYIPGFEPSAAEGYIRLTTHNRMAASLNARKLDGLPGPLHSYEATVKGDFPESNFPAGKTLALKVGAQVMFIKNDTSERRFYNGMLGKVVSLGDEKIRVRPLGSDEVIDVEPATWENTKYTINEDSKAIVTEVIGEFSQYPLRLAWSITIHKSQGLTFDKAVIDARSAFAAGQTYVALSRCTSLAGLVLSAPIPPSAVIIDDEVSRFSTYCESRSIDENGIRHLKSEYIRALISDLFDFSGLRSAFKDFYRAVNEYIVPYYPSLGEEMRQNAKAVDEDIDTVGKRFVAGNVMTSPDPFALLADEAFLLRIRKGCEYFLDRLKKISAKIDGMTKITANARHAKRLETTYDALADQLEMKTGVMEKMRDIDFTVAGYIRAKGVAAAGMQRERDAIQKTSKRRRKAKP